jgi:hypothetical protein
MTDIEKLTHLKRNYEWIILNNNRKEYKKNIVELTTKIKILLEKVKQQI